MSAPASGMLSAQAQEIATGLGLTLGPPNLDVFAGTLLELAQSDRSIVVVASDSRGSGKLTPFAQALPGQFVEVGIAEQNLVGVTAGLAACGKKSFGVSPACFLTTRALEQIKNDICYSDVPAVVVGISAGVSYGALGSTHHSLHDFAALRAIHNIAILAPADEAETRAAVHAAAVARYPVYLRFGKALMLRLPEREFTIGRARELRAGNDLVWIATGETVVHAFLAAEFLAHEGIRSRVISMHTVRPLDAAAVLDCARDCAAVVTVEEHSVHGGLGEACAHLILESGIQTRFRSVGIPDADTVTGSQADIFRHYGIGMESLAAQARALLA